MGPSLAARIALTRGPGSGSSQKVRLTKNLESAARAICTRSHPHSKILVPILPKSHAASDAAPKRTNAKIAVKNTSRVPVCFRVVQLPSAVAGVDRARPGEFYVLRPGITVLLENTIRELGEFHYICLECVNESGWAATLDFAPDAEMRHGETYLQGAQCPRRAWDGRRFLR